MSVISGCLRYLAILLILIVLVTLPLALLGRSLGQMLFTQEEVVGLLNENLLDGEIVSIVGERMVDNAVQRGGDRTPVEELVVAGLANLTHEQWLELFQLIAPPELLSQTLEQIVSGMFAWLENSEPYPYILIDLRPWKSNGITNALPALELIFNALPQCSPEQIASFFLGEVENVGTLPLCRPPEPLYSELLSLSVTLLPSQIANTRDEVDVFANTNITPEAMNLLKDNLRKLRFFLRWSWIVVILLYLVSIPLGMRSASGFFKWAGAPLFLSGIFTLILALVILLFTRGLPLRLVGRILGLEFTGAAFLVFQTAITALLARAARPLLVQAAVMIFLGGGSLVLAVILGSVLRLRAQSQTNLASQPEYYGPTQGEPYQHQAPPREDHDGPEGMFG